MASFSSDCLVRNGVWLSASSEVLRKYSVGACRLLHSIAYVESRYNPSAVSPAGAKGMMQIMPATARRLGLQGSEEQLFNPLVSLHLSSTYLRILYDLFGNDLELVLAAYNAGENAVIKYGYTIPPYRETQNYVKSVMNYYLNIKA